MRTSFPGYFRPDENEFAELWTNCTFGFDANVLLGLYRSSTETQNVFFETLEKLGDRIFLPYQAASEYLERRLDVITDRAKKYQTIKDAASKIAETIKTEVGEHALSEKRSMLRIAEKFAQDISAVIDDLNAKEPDLQKSDYLRDRIAALFDGRVGTPTAEARLKEIYAAGVERFARRIPPGYKDDKKEVPRKYGDLVIWFQLVEHAKSSKRPMIFVTVDSKEDWWLIHNGATLGPRPELGQEMFANAAVRFYMYTTAQFVEYAKQFLNLKFITKKAVSEFEKIEEDDKKSAERHKGVIEMILESNALAEAKAQQRLNALFASPQIDSSKLAAALAQTDWSKLASLPQIDWSKLTTPPQIDWSKLTSFSSVVPQIDFSKLTAVPQFDLSKLATVSQIDWSKVTIAPQIDLSKLTALPQIDLSKLAVVTEFDWPKFVAAQATTAARGPATIGGPENPLDPAIHPPDHSPSRHSVNDAETSSAKPDSPPEPLGGGGVEGEGKNGK